MVARVIHILSRPPIDQNARAFVAPLIASRRALAARGIRCRIFESPSPTLADCDWERPLNELGLTRELEQAVVVHGGQLTPRYAHLAGHVGSSRHS